MRSGFENYLIDKGYIPHSYSAKTEILEPTEKEGYSSMSVLRLVYIHPNDEDCKIIYGLNQYPFPPTLISPRPNIRIYTETEDCILVKDEQRDEVMIEVMQKETYDDIYNAMKDKSKVFEYGKKRI